MIPGKRRSGRRLLLRGPATAALVALAFALAPGISAADDAPSDSLGGPFTLHRRDLLLLGSGGLLGGLGTFVLKADILDVPTSGLDRNDIHLDWDRRSIGTPTPSALDASSAALGISAILPLAYNLAFPSPEGGKRGFFRLGVTETEAVFLAMGGTQFVKSVTERPRPYTYLPERDRPGGIRYDAGQRVAFESFPSGHATLAWATAMTGVGYLANQRPDLPGWIHFAGGAAAGGFATATAVLRVKGQVHFPSDVVAGSLWGGAVGTAVVLIRGGPSAPGDRGSAWLRSLLGVAAGSALALLLTPPTSPWID